MKNASQLNSKAPNPSLKPRSNSWLLTVQRLTVQDQTCLQCLLKRGHIGHLGCPHRDGMHFLWLPFSIPPGCHSRRHGLHMAPRLFSFQPLTHVPRNLERLRCAYAEVRTWVFNAGFKKKWREWSPVSSDDKYITRANFHGCWASRIFHFGKQIIEFVRIWPSTYSMILLLGM